MNMIEKVVIAIQNNFDYDVKYEVLQAIAKVAIQAMREPTTEMKNVKTDLGDVHWDYQCHVCGGAKFNYQAMIDEALKND